MVDAKTRKALEMLKVKIDQMLANNAVTGRDLQEFFIILGAVVKSEVFGPGFLSLLGYLAKTPEIRQQIPRKYQWAVDVFCSQIDKYTK